VDICLEAFKQNPSVMSKFPDSIKEDEDFCFDILRTDGIQLEHFPEKFRKNKDLVMEAVS
jgi:hypothetical protein